MGASHAFQEVLRRTHLSGFAEIATVFAEEVRTPCADSVVPYRPNYQPALLVAVPAADAVGRPPLPVLGTVVGRAFGATAIAELDADGGSGRRLRLSLLDGWSGATQWTSGSPTRTGRCRSCRSRWSERYAHVAAVMSASNGLKSDAFELIRGGGRWWWPASCRGVRAAAGPGIG